MSLTGNVLIIGAGIGGVTLARALHSRGIGYELFERSSERSATGAGLLVHPGAAKALAALGVARELTSAGMELLRGKALTRDGALLQASSLRALRDAAGAGTHGVHRARLHALLLAGLQPVRLGRAFVSAQEYAGGVRATFADGSVAEGALLVGADGLRSRVRAMLYGDLPPRYAGYTSWRGVAPGERYWDGPELAEFWGRGERFGVVPVGHGETYWFAVANAPEGERDDDPLEAVKRRFGGWSAPIPELLSATPPQRVLRTDIHDRAPIRSWSRGRVTLLGDAAHPMTPNLGQGACMAIEDAVVLARCLAESADWAPALSSYEARRIRRTSQMVERSRQLGRLAQLENPMLVWLRNALLKATPASVVQRQMRANAMLEL
jgi:2-polyprenyl-6-methoxyphenol hydroxylase-like FAD-dependent oxidoreductase